MIFHSDQGSQYCDHQFRATLKLTGFEQSMSRRGNCYDNAHLESFFHTLKNELNTTAFTSLEEARSVIFAYIEAWYNTTRIHSALGYMSPMEYE